MLSVIYIMLFTLQAEPVTHVFKWLYQKSNLYLSVNDFPLMLSAALCSKVRKKTQTHYQKMISTCIVGNVGSRKAGV